MAMLEGSAAGAQAAQRAADLERQLEAAQQVRQPHHVACLLQQYSPGF